MISMRISPKLFFLEFRLFSGVLVSKSLTESCTAYHILSIVLVSLAKEKEISRGSVAVAGALPPYGLF